MMVDMKPRPIDPADMSPDLIARFWAKTEPDGDCIVWTGATTPTGYGKFSLHRGPRARRYNAHRYAYAITHGDTEQEVDHLCRRRNCVRPDHLEAVDRPTNVQRAAKDACPQGHPYEEGNLYYDKGRPGQNPTRRCKECRKAQSKARYDRMKEN